MKVLFIGGANNASHTIPSLVKAQGDSLQNMDVQVLYFGIKGKGLIGYLKNIIRLRKFIKDNQIDIIHAHYSFSALVSNLALTGKPIILSLLGSDVNSNRGLHKIILRFVLLFPIKLVIVKSEEMRKKVRTNKKVVVLPNGVNTDIFHPKIPLEEKRKFGWDTSKYHILFPANPNRIEKNFVLLDDALKKLKTSIEVEVHYFDNTPFSDVPNIINACDIIVLCSLWEGSPNAIKEAMACNKVIVSTNVGDIEWLFESVKGTFISENTSDHLAEKINDAILYFEDYHESQGRKRIEELDLSSIKVAERLKGFYENALT